MRPALRVAGTAVLSAAAATAAAWTGLLDPWHAFAAGGLVTTLAIVWTATGTPVDDPAWPRRTEEVRPGGRHDVSDLGWSTFGRDGRVTDRVVYRVRALADRRLRLLGVDPDDPAQRPEVERLLGARVLAQMTSRQPPTARSLQAWLDAVDRLAPENIHHPRRNP
ncbi:hypothetical protein L1785_07605 [Antribacter sp. KLBMP9083]|uniref:PH domain-containing protein n=1 Tax=Antribacter soli TaxID=2910976 RepID=A0AA41U8U7_9MICO|nr:hypothetical protein [Antribacter soli]MCF4120842.1 hypothetical protein [Antribacter soli]